ncbi:hypothetical protein L3X38_027068 [Prunus dulcis]|uniref:Uncharacterized protein n=1 Tax=Prunus dulcis TaxID=3755 RepID=A0AAD4VP20_PRUDU|nr:hypothetical protein L3X38_027068 [Prunus dulcis]
MTSPTMDKTNATKAKGFGWDPIANTVTASKDVWASYLKGRYSILLLQPGSLHCASSQLPPNSDDERELENNFLNTGVHFDVYLDNDGDNPQLVSGKGKRKCTTAAPGEGYYYVVDARYSNMPGFLAHYQGERYHLRDYRGPRRAPRGPM